MVKSQNTVNLKSDVSNLPNFLYLKGIKGDFNSLNN